MMSSYYKSALYNMLIQQEIRLLVRLLMFTRLSLEYIQIASAQDVKNRETDSSEIKYLELRQTESLTFM